MKPDELDLLRKYFPASAVEQVAALYASRLFRLEFKPPRRSKLGDFRMPRGKHGICHITLNGDLHPYQMLITFVHEVAHYDVFQQYGRDVRPHGEEWKRTYVGLLRPFVDGHVFPPDVEAALREHFGHVGASSVADAELLRVLRRHENPDGPLPTVDDLPEGARFMLGNGRVYEKGAKQRTRCKCRCLDDGRWYSVSVAAVARPV